MYGAKLGPGAATGLGAASVGGLSGGWIWFIAILVAFAVILIARAFIQRRRAMMLAGTARPIAWRRGKPSDPWTAKSGAQHRQRR